MRRAGALRQPVLSRPARRVLVGAADAPEAVQHAEHGARADERDADEGALQRVEDDEGVPEHVPVGERGEEAEYPRAAHQDGQLDVEQEVALRSTIVAACCRRVLHRQADADDGDAVEHDIDDEQERERQREQHHEGAAARDPAQRLAVAGPVLVGEAEEVERQRAADDEGRTQPGVERVEGEALAAAGRGNAARRERATQVDSEHIHPEEGGEEGVVHAGAACHTHGEHLDALGADEEEQLSDERRRGEAEHALAGNVAQRRDHGEHDEEDGEREQRHERADDRDESLQAVELEHRAGDVVQHDVLAAVIRRADEHVPAGAAVLAGDEQARDGHVQQRAVRERHVLTLVQHQLRTFEHRVRRRRRRRRGRRQWGVWRRPWPGSAEVHRWWPRGRFRRHRRRRRRPSRRRRRLVRLWLRSVLGGGGRCCRRRRRRRRVARRRCDVRRRPWHAVAGRHSRRAIHRPADGLVGVVDVPRRAPGHHLHLLPAPRPAARRRHRLRVEIEQDRKRRPATHHSGWCRGHRNYDRTVRRADVVTRRHALVHVVTRGAVAVLERFQLHVHVVGGARPTASLRVAPARPVAVAATQVRLALARRLAERVTQRHATVAAAVARRRLQVRLHVPRHVQRARVPAAHVRVPEQRPTHAGTRRAEVVPIQHVRVSVAHRQREEAVSVAGRRALALFAQRAVAGVPPRTAFDDVQLEARIDLVDAPTRHGAALQLPDPVGGARPREVGAAVAVARAIVVAETVAELEGCCGRLRRGGARAARVADVARRRWRGGRRDDSAADRQRDAQPREAHGPHGDRSVHATAVWRVRCPTCQREAAAPGYYWRGGSRPAR